MCEHSLACGFFWVHFPLSPIPHNTPLALNTNGAWSAESPAPMEVTTATRLHPAVFIALMTLRDPSAGGRVGLFTHDNTLFSQST